jgi:hypothetical protein
MSLVPARSRQLQRKLFAGQLLASADIHRCLLFLPEVDLQACSSSYSLYRLSYPHHLETKNIWNISSLRVAMKMGKQLNGVNYAIALRFEVFMAVTMKNAVFWDIRT